MKNITIMGLLVLIALLLSILIIDNIRTDKIEIIEKEVQCATYQEVYTNEAKGCDKIPNCGCLHRNWFGYGTCDSCQCVRYITSCK